MELFLIGTFATYEAILRSVPDGSNQIGYLPGFTEMEVIYV